MFYKIFLQTALLRAVFFRGIFPQIVFLRGIVLRAILLRGIFPRTIFPRIILLRGILLQIIFLLAIISLFSCKTTRKATIDPGKTVDVTTSQLRSVAQQFSDALVDYLDQQGQLPTYLSLLKTKNNSTEILPLEVLEDEMVRLLIEKRVYTIRRENRAEALKELQLALSGLTDGSAEAGQLKSPKYFVKITINENQVLAKNAEIQERTYSIDLRSVQTQLTVFQKTIVTTESRPLGRRSDYF